MKKLLLILLCLPMIGFGQVEKEMKLDNIIGGITNGINVGKVIIKGDVAPAELVGYESQGGCVVQDGYSVSIVYKGNKHIILFEKLYARDNNGKSYNKILDYAITHCNKDEGILICDLGTVTGIRDDRIIAKAVFRDWEFVKVTKAWKINIDKLRIDMIGTSNISYEHEGL